MADDFDVAVDGYLARAYDGDRRNRLLAGGHDPDFVTELADLGWFALAVPLDRDGLGAPLAALGPVFTQFGRHLMVGPMLENMLLPAVLDLPAGRPVALVDPGVTEAWSAAVGSVTLDGQRLDGAVNAVRFARQADLLVVVAAADRGPVVCLVDAAQPGVRIDDLESADPTAEFARVVLDGVRAGTVVADDELVGRLRSWARLLIACELSGIAQHCLGRTVEYLGQREQFGRVIGSFQAVKHMAADMHTRWAGLHNLCLAAVADADGASAADLDLIASTAKAHAAQAAVQICEDAIQLHGGIGFTTEGDVSWYYRRALALRSWYGDETELAARIGATRLERQT